MASSADSSLGISNLPVLDRVVLLPLDFFGSCEWRLLFELGT